MTEAKLIEYYEALNLLRFRTKDKTYHIDGDVAAGLLVEAIEKKAEPRKQAAWKPLGPYDVLCTGCNYVMPAFSAGNYCPRCGAKMKEEEQCD